MSVYSFLPPSVSQALQKMQIKNKGTATESAEYHQLWNTWIDDFDGCTSKREWSITNGIHDALIQQCAYRSRDHKKFYRFEDDYQYYYHILLPYENETITWDQLDTIEPNSYIITSQPNHTGSIHPKLNDLIETCKQRNCHIFLDCAFYGNSFESLDTSDSVYDAVAFSLSKNFMLAGLRAGIVYGDDLASSLTIPVHGNNFNYNYYNIMAVEGAKTVLSQFDARYVTRVAKPIQLRYCEENNLTPCQLWMTAYDGDKRVCVTDYIREEIINELYVSR